MNAEVMVFLDTENSGRVFDVRTSSIRTFCNMQELQLLCQVVWLEVTHMSNYMMFQDNPEKGKLASLRISICTVDQVGVHGMLHVSSSYNIAFKSSDELNRLIRKESSRALKRQQQKASRRCGITMQNGAESVSPPT